MPGRDRWVVVGLDNGGTTNNATVLDSDGRFLVDEMVECPSCVRSGPDKAIEALEGSLNLVLELTGIPREMVRAVGLDTPGPVTAEGVIAAGGATNFGNPAWSGFDVRGALERRLGIPVQYNNDANAAALYAHHAFFGAEQATARSSVSVIVGTGLGGGVVEAGRVVHGAAGMAGELGHVWIPMDGLLGADQLPPACNCGLSGDAESVASLTGIGKNLLPYWLGRYPDHPLARVSLADAAKQVRDYGEAGDPLALRIFAQQAMAIGRLFTIAANFTDPDAYFLGGGVVEAAPHFRDWFLDRVREHTALRAEQEKVATIALVPDLDMAGARGSAIAASTAVVGLSSGCLVLAGRFTCGQRAAGQTRGVAGILRVSLEQRISRMERRWTRTGPGHFSWKSAAMCRNFLPPPRRQRRRTGRPRTRWGTAPIRQPR